MKATDDVKSYQKKRRILGIISLIVVALLFLLLTFFIWKYLSRFSNSPDQFKEYIESFGWKGRFVFLGLQCLQVIIALIPGELIEIGAGYAFGPVEGTILCMAGVAVSSVLIFLLTRKWGVRLVEIFISREKINELRFINSEHKLKRTIFILFFIPGTPKDLFTYFIGLTKIRLHEFLIISLIARIPSIMSSTIGGHIIGQENYAGAVLLFAITGLVSLGGMKLYSEIVKRRQSKDGLDKNTIQEDSSCSDK